MLVQTILSNSHIDYNGSQLRSRWIADTFGITGNAAVVFIGRCNILPEYMVDLADKAAGCKIFSEEMLHFIVERFDTSLSEMIVHQRLFVAIIKDAILQQARAGRNLEMKRRGNDLYDGDAKINVSVATTSPVSALMHIGVNISSHNTPVKTKSLNDYGINPKTSPTY